MRAAGNSGQYFLRVLTGGKVADAVESLARDVAEQGPELRFGVGDLFAVIDNPADGFLLLTLAREPFHPMNLIIVERSR